MEIGIIGGCEDFVLGKSVPAKARLVDQGWRKGMHIAESDILVPAQIVPRVVSPNGQAGLKGVIEKISTVDKIFRGKSAINSCIVVVLIGTGFSPRCVVIADKDSVGDHGRIREWFKSQERERLRAQRARALVGRNAAVELILQSHRVTLRICKAGKIACSLSQRANKFCLGHRSLN